MERIFIVTCHELRQTSTSFLRDLFFISFGSRLMCSFILKDKHIDDIFFSVFGIFNSGWLIITELRIDKNENRRINTLIISVNQKISFITIVLNSKK